MKGIANRITRIKGEKIRDKVRGSGNSDLVFPTLRGDISADDLHLIFTRLWLIYRIDSKGVPRLISDVRGKGYRLGRYLNTRGIHEQHINPASGPVIGGKLRPFNGIINRCIFGNFLTSIDISFVFTNDGIIGNVNNDFIVNRLHIVKRHFKISVFNSRSSDVL